MGRMRLYEKDCKREPDVVLAPMSDEELAFHKLGKAAIKAAEDKKVMEWIEMVNPFQESPELWRKMQANAYDEAMKVLAP